jgi:diguanylate cyclase (GGDEF)-like protein
VPLLSIAVVVVVLVWDHFERIHEASVWLAAGTLVLVAARLMISFRENERLVDILHDDSVTDPLTQLGNRRALITDLDHVLAGDGDGGGGSYLFALFDLDGFKFYNDSFGHPAGDALLRRLGTGLKAALGTLGDAYRLGGDEFCILVRLDGAKPAALVELARAALSERGEGFTVGASAGSVLLPVEAAASSEALRVADKRLYAEKAERSSRSGDQTRTLLLRVQREREPALGEHVDWVAHASVDLGRRLELDSESLDVLGRAAEFHDIGKIAIPEDILSKPGPLTENEWTLMRRHTLIGERILGVAPALTPVARVVRSTHERWDGGGYPDGLAGTEIPLEARIIFVCDAFEAMTSDRPYKPAMSAEEALEELRRNAGTQFDPEIVDLFCEATAAGEIAPRAGDRVGSPR